MPRMRIVFVSPDRGARRRGAQALIDTGHQVFSFELGEDALRAMMYADVIVSEGTRRPMDDVDFLLRVRTVSASPVVVVSPYSVEFVRTYGDMIGSLLTVLDEDDLAPVVTSVIAAMTPAPAPAETPTAEGDATVEPVADVEPAPKKKRSFFASFSYRRQSLAGEEQAAQATKSSSDGP